MVGRSTAAASEPRSGGPQEEGHWQGKAGLAALARFPARQSKGESPHAPAAATKSSKNPFKLHHVV